MIVLWAIEDDGYDVYEDYLLGVFATTDDAKAFWQGMTDSQRHGYYPLYEQWTLGVGLVPPPSGPHRSRA